MTDQTPQQDPIGQMRKEAETAATSLFSRLWAIGGEVLVGRMAQWLWATVPAVAVVGFVNVEALGPIVKVLAKVTLGAWIGYWIDRASFRDARPHEPLAAARFLRDNGESERADRLLDIASRYQWRRAWVISACVLALAIGV